MASEEQQRRGDCWFLLHDIAGNLTDEASDTLYPAFNPELLNLGINYPTVQDHERLKKFDRRIYQKLHPPPAPAPAPAPKVADPQQ